MKTTLTLLLLSLSFALLSQQNLSDSLNINLPKKKERKREIYINFYKPNLSAEDNSVWSGSYFDLPLIDSVYYSYQDLRNHKFDFEGVRGIALGYNKSRKISNKISFKSGFAINIFGFDYTNTYTIDTTITLDKYQVLNPSEPSKVLITTINEIRGFPSTNGPYITRPSQSFVLVSLLIPFSLEYKLSNNLFIGGDLNYNFVITGEVSSYYRRTDGSRFNTRENSDAIGRVYATFGLHFKYNIYKNYFIELNGGFGGGVFKYNLENESSVFDGLKNVRLLNYGLKVGYNF